jgi:Domain of unknown function (DUF4861)
MFKRRISMARQTMSAFTLSWTAFGFSVLFLSLAQVINAEDKPSGVVLFNAAHQPILHDKMSASGKEYFSWPRGPFIENKYCAYRLLVASEFVGAIDPFGKTKYVSILSHFHDPKFNKGAKHDFGYDAYHVGNLPGIGAPMFKVGTDWVTLPHWDKTDGIEVELLETASAAPRYRVTYKNWKIDDRQKIDVVLDIFTAWEDRHVQVQLKVSGFSGLVGAGLQPADNLEPVKDERSALLYHYGVFQKGNEIVQAIHADPIYFQSFDKDDQGEVMVLKADESGLFKWHLLHSWGAEPSPLFKEERWQEKLIYKATKAEAAKPE